MTANDQRLNGLSVLVLEDEYLLADDARRVLRSASARVMGPFGSADDALAAAKRDKPDCALVDLNLGTGPDFGPARAFKARGIPVVFFSGYDPAVMPADFRGAHFLQKPIHMAMIVDIVAAVCGRSDDGPALDGLWRAGFRRMILSAAGSTPSC